MAASSPVGNVTKVEIVSKDGNDNTYQQTPNSRLIPRTDATYSNMDTSSRALIQLSDNAYNDTILITQVSVTEQVVE